MPLCKKNTPLTVAPSTLPLTTTTLIIGKRALTRRIGSDTIPLPLIQQAHYHWPNQSRQASLPKYILPPKIVKPWLQASLPASVTRVLPHTLGKAPARLANRTHQWYVECDIEDPCLEALFKEAKQLNGWNHNTTQCIMFQCVTTHKCWLCKLDIFPFEEGLPP